MGKGITSWFTVNNVDICTKTLVLWVKRYDVHAKYWEDALEKSTYKNYILSRNYVTDALNEENVITWLKTKTSECIQEATYL